MEKNNVQLELFSQNKRSESEKKTASVAFLNYICGYEKTVLVLIAFIITAVIFFCLGVEKGKNLAVKNADSHLDMASAVEPGKPQITVQTTSQQLIQSKPDVQQEDILKPLPREKKDKAVKPIQKQQDMGNYTIQIATYQTRANAQKEADILKKKGLSALVLSKNAYTILCVGRFLDKRTAKTTLVELKKKYNDCFIRRL